MPYLLNEEGVIVEDLDGVSWTDVIKQQRARASNEARVAAMYAELDAVEEEIQEIAETRMKNGIEFETKPNGELVRIEIGKEHDALIASLSERMEASEIRNQETAMALVAALQQIGLREPVFNVEAPNVNIEPAAITVEQPDITVNTPEVVVQAAAPPNVTVNPEIVVPQSEAKKTVTFVRDYTGRIEGAEIAEE